MLVLKMETFTLLRCMESTLTIPNIQNNKLYYQSQTKGDNIIEVYEGHQAPISSLNIMPNRQDIASDVLIKLLQLQKF